MLASPNTGHCVAMVIRPEESYLNLASGAGSGHLQTGTRWQGALWLSPPITTPVVYTNSREPNDNRHTPLRGWAITWRLMITVYMLAGKNMNMLTVTQFYIQCYTDAITCVLT